jgi:hypothetical protein
VDDPRYDDIRDAARKALSVLGMGTGISHMEWFRRKDGTVAISEVAARPPGAQITTLMSLAHDFNVLAEWSRAMIFGEFRVPNGIRWERRSSGGGGASLPCTGSMTCGASWATWWWTPTCRRSAPPVTSYEGDGFIIVRHPETKRVEEAIMKIVSTIRVELS